MRGWKPRAGAPLALPAATSEGRNLRRGEFKGVLQLLALMDEELKPAAASPRFSVLSGKAAAAASPRRRSCSTASTASAPPRSVGM